MAEAEEIAKKKRASMDSKLAGLAGVSDSCHNLRAFRVNFNS